MCKMIQNKSLSHYFACCTLCYLVFKLTLYYLCMNIFDMDASDKIILLIEIITLQFKCIDVLHTCIL